MTGYSTHLIPSRQLKLRLSSPRRASSGSLGASTFPTLTAITLCGSAISSSAKNPSSGWRTYADCTSRRRITYYSHFHHIQDLSLTTILQREWPTQPAPIYPTLRQKVGGRVGRRDEHTTMVGVVCLEQDNLALPVVSLNIQGEVRGIFLSVGERASAQKTMLSVFTESNFHTRYRVVELDFDDDEPILSGPPRPGSYHHRLWTPSRPAAHKRGHAGAHVQFPSSEAMCARRRISLSFPE